MQVNEHLECFSQRLLSVHSKGLPGNCSKVSQPALIGQSQGGFRSEMLGPLRFTPPVCFLPQQHRSYMSFCAQPAGNWGVRYNKKGDWGVLSLGLWFINLHSFKFQTNCVGLWYTPQGVILQHRTIQIHQSPIFSSCQRIDNIPVQCCWGTSRTSELQSQKFKNLKSLTKSRELCLLRTVF